MTRHISPAPGTQIIGDVPEMNHTGRIGQRNERGGETLAALLKANGIPDGHARVLGCFSNGGGLTQDDLGRLTGLHQPDVSVATRALTGRGWLDCSQITAGNGRSVNVYWLAQDMRIIVRDIVRERNRQIDEQMEMAAQLLQAVRA